MRVFIVDDEPLARARLARLLAQLPEHQCIGEAETVADAWSKILRLQPEIILLDIEMPGQDGISLGCRLSSLPLPPAIIFVTAHPRHALDAFKANPAGYLLKPVDCAQLSAALEKAVKLTKAQLIAQPVSAEIQFIEHGIKRTVPLSVVQYIVAEDKYCRLFHLDGEVLLDDSLTALEQAHPQQLLRIHRSTLVNIEAIARLFVDSSGRHLVQLKTSNVTLDVSRRALAKVKHVLR